MSKRYNPNNPNNGFQYMEVGGANHANNHYGENNDADDVGLLSKLNCCGADDKIVLNDKDLCKLGTGCSIFTILLIIFFSCLNFISYDQYALTRNRLGTVYETPVLTQGTYWLFPIYGTVIFPSTLVEVNFESTVFSDTGLEFILQIWSCYELPKDDIYDIYNKFSSSYDSRVQSISRKTIKNLAATFSITEFLQNRTKIEQVISIGVYNDLMSEMGVNAPTQYFKITDIQFPQNILNNSLNSALALQNNQLQQNQQEVQIVTADTAKMVASINAQTNQIIQNSVSESNQIIAYGSYKSDSIVASARSEGMKNTIAVVGLTGSSVIDFVNVMALIDNNNKTIIHDVSSQVILNTN